MKINPGIKAYAIIVLIALLIPISINWFTFLARTISDDNETPDTSREHTDILGKNEASDTMSESYKVTGKTNDENAFKEPKEANGNNQNNQNK